MRVRILSQSSCTVIIIPHFKCYLELIIRTPDHYHSLSISFFISIPHLDDYLKSILNLSDHRVNERRHLLALGIKTQYDIDFAAGKYPVEEE